MRRTSVLLVMLPLLLFTLGCQKPSQPSVVKNTGTIPAIEVPPRVEAASTPIPSTSSAQISEVTESPMTISDYYYKIPTRYLGSYGDASDKIRKQWIRKLDTENDYIEFRNLKGETGGEMAVFRTKDGAGLIAVSYAACGPICDQSLALLRYRNGVWNNVTTTELPEIKKSEAKALLISKLRLEDHSSSDPEDIDFAPLIQIPRHGTRMKYYDQYSGKVLYEIVWTKNHFETRVCDDPKSACQKLEE